MQNTPETPRPANVPGIRPGVWISMAVLIVGAVAVIALSRKQTKVSEEVASVHNSAAGEEQEQTAVDSAEVKSVFERYRTALLQGDDETAWFVIDSHSRNFYSKTVGDGLFLGRPNLDRLDPMHKFMVLRTRVEFRRQEMQKLTGRSLFAAAVTNGWISRSSVERVPALHRVAIKDQYAAAYIAEAPEVPLFYFIKESEGWKLSLWKSFEAANAEMRQLRKKSGLSENDFFMDMLRRVSKYEVDARIFNGPID